MTDIEITLADPADAAAIAHVKATGWRTTYSEWVPARVLNPLADQRALLAETAALLGEPENFAVLARADDRVLGFASCIAAGRVEPLLDSFHVLPEARGRGVGSLLLARFAQEVERRGASTLVVAVVDANTRTRALYERLGASYTTTAPADWAPEFVREAHYRWDDLRPLQGL